MLAVTDLQLLLDEMCAYQDALVKGEMQDEMMAEAESEARQGARRERSDVVHIGEDIAARVKRMRGEE